MSLLERTISWLEEKNPNQDEFLQSAKEVCEYIVPIVNASEDYKAHNVLQRILTHDQILEFTVTWENDKGYPEVNRAWRVQHSNALGPYKGGTRFHPQLNISTLKFLAFEQSFKNALTQLTLGSGKGGSDFNPKGRSENEIRRFCNAYMRAIYKHIGPNTDVPAGDINVGDKELGYMFGEYLRLAKSYDGALSGKPIALGGSCLRAQATGFGVIYFVQEMLKSQDKQIDGLSVLISGAGNVALHAALKALQLGAKVPTLSNSRGVLIAEEGLTQQQLDWLLEEGKKEKNSLESLAKKDGLIYKKNESPWSLKADIGIPCATQNEINGDTAKKIVKNLSFGVVEGANMPCTQEASDTLLKSKLHYAPGKAANAGGVIVSGFEMQQNAMMRYETEAELDERLQQKMSDIHQACEDESRAQGNDTVNYVQGANIVGFRRLADAIVAQGY
ncbi:MAG: glutamate dehydrogenase (NADP+) [Glaciecola sp.]|jgi:glutamate dehydrogenase (NADP+)